MLKAKSGEFLLSVTLKGKGEARSGGIENSLPVQNSYINISLSDYDMVAVEKGFFYMDGNNFNRTRIYRSLTDFSNLKGMYYYSQTQAGNTYLITDSYRINSGADYRTENIKNADIPVKTVSGFAVKDNRLGLLTFRSELTSSGDDFIMVNISTGNASKFGMQIFYPGDYRIYKFLIYDRNLKGYFFYTAQFMKVRSNILSRMDLIKPESFGNRVRAEDIHFLKSIGIDRSEKLAAFK
jgi:hypothetical protein